MKLAICSGKGGTGKTTVATNLAAVAADDGRSVAYLDCDVEEPNGGLFLQPEIEVVRPVEVSVPRVDEAQCTGCGKCGEICRFNAIVVVGGKPLLFPELCHGCAGCWLVCPTGAVTEGYRRTGDVSIGAAGGVRFVQGQLNIGEAMSPPVISAVKEAAPQVDLRIVDAPPGTSCPVIEAVRDSDYVLLVTEPTPFGLNDLKLAVEMVRALELPFAVAINRAVPDEHETRAYCEAESIPVVAEIPDDRRVAEAYSRGEMACRAVPDHAELYGGLLARIEAKAGVPPAVR